MNKSGGGLSTLERIFVDNEFNIKGCFDDESLILLDPQGRFYVCIESDSKLSRHLTSCALHCHAHRLSQVIYFRNLYLEDSIYSPWFMRDEVNRRSIQISEHAISISEQPSKITSNGEYVEVYRDESCTRLVYDSIGKRIAISYPLFIDFQTTVMEEKIFPATDCPARWLPALKLALQALPNGCEDFELPSTIESVKSAEHSKSDLRSFEEGSWWTRSTSVLPDNVTIIVDWTPAAMIRYDRSTDEARAWIDNDDSFLITSHRGRFMTHVGRNPLRETVCKIDSRTSQIGGIDRHFDYDLRKIVQRMVQLR